MSSFGRSSSKRKRLKGWGKRRGISGNFDDNEYSEDDDEDKETLQAAIATANDTIAEAKEHDKLSFPMETDEECRKRIQPFKQPDGTYMFPGITTYMWNNVEWILTAHLVGFTGTKGMLPMLMRRQCTMVEKVTMIEMGILKPNLKSMNCAVYLYRDADALMTKYFSSQYEEAKQKDLIQRRVFYGTSTDVYDGIYNGDKNAPLPAPDGSVTSFGATKKKYGMGRQDGGGGAGEGNSDALAKALHSTRDFNNEILRERQNYRQVFYDTHTRIVHIPKMYSVEYTESVGEDAKRFPAAALPNQFMGAYTEYTPEQMSMLPLDTVTKWHVAPGELFPAEGEDSGDEQAGDHSDNEADADTAVPEDDDAP